MKDLVRESWKIAVAFAAGAFLLSLLIGLITRNPFGVVFLRALLLALLFAGFGTGLRYAVRTWLPELAGQPATAPVRDSARGSKVDIVLGDDAIVPGLDGLPGGESLSGSADARPAREEPGTESATPEEALGELTGELSEEESGADDMPVAGETVGESEDDPDELPGVAADLAPARSSHGSSLPDITLGEGSSGPGDAREAGKGRRAPLHAKGGLPSDAVRESVARQDPATLARALRTVLKKDDKG